MLEMYYNFFFKLNLMKFSGCFYIYLYCIKGKEAVLWDFIIPVAIGTGVALAIAFGFVLVRNCRRRKLIKVRFGGKVGTRFDVVGEDRSLAYCKAIQSIQAIQAITRMQSPALLSNILLFVPLKLNML